MKLVSLKIIDADTCGGLLNGLSIPFREGNVDIQSFSPLCLIGPNGTGKSQVLQIVAEIFQAVFKEFVPNEETGESNSAIQFEIEYLLYGDDGKETRVRIYRHKLSQKKAAIVVEGFVQGEWRIIQDGVEKFLPKKVVGYTSGDNETLSIPFFVSRAGYAKQVRDNALDPQKRLMPILDSRMMLIDYGTNLEVLVANLLLNSDQIRKKLVEEPNLKSLHSFRCVIQLKNSAVPRGVKLTLELEKYVEYLKKCATCHTYNEKNNEYIFDFFVQNATHEAFENFWPGGSLELYTCFHKLAMLNDLAIPGQAREKFKSNIKNRNFASRLPEPADFQKVFKFESVKFISNKSGKAEIVDYVSLSDGEHQLAQLLGTLCMVNYRNVLFLLDEPESHFNPRWRVEFISKVMNLPTLGGKRDESGESVAVQDCLITTHSPFVPSDMHRENVIIFSKNKEKGNIDVRRPRIQTYGSRFDSILAECFDVSPPISAVSRNQLTELLDSGTVDQIEQALNEVGESSMRMKLAGKLARLKEV